jgi:hypothetical protein
MFCTTASAEHQSLQEALQVAQTNIQTLNSQSIHQKQHIDQLTAQTEGLKRILMRQKTANSSALSDAKLDSMSKTVELEVALCVSELSAVTTSEYLESRRTELEAEVLSLKEQLLQLQQLRQGDVQKLRELQNELEIQNVSAQQQKDILEQVQFEKAELELQHQEAVTQLDTYANKELNLNAHIARVEALNVQLTRSSQQATADLAKLKQQLASKVSGQIMSAFTQALADIASAESAQLALDQAEFKAVQSVREMEKLLLSPSHLLNQQTMNVNASSVQAFADDEVAAAVTQFAAPSPSIASSLSLSSSSCNESINSAATVDANAGTSIDVEDETKVQFNSSETTAMEQVEASNIHCDGNVILEQQQHSHPNGPHHRATLSSDPESKSITVASAVDAHVDVAVVSASSASDSASDAISNAKSPGSLSLSSSAVGTASASVSKSDKTTSGELSVGESLTQMILDYQRNIDKLQKLVAQNDNLVKQALAEEDNSPSSMSASTTSATAAISTSVTSTPSSASTCSALATSVVESSPELQSHCQNLLMIEARISHALHVTTAAAQSRLNTLKAENTVLYNSIVASIARNTQLLRQATQHQLDIKKQDMQAAKTVLHMIRAMKQYIAGQHKQIEEQLGKYRIILCNAHLLRQSCNSSVQLEQSQNSAQMITRIRELEIANSEHVRARNTLTQTLEMKKLDAVLNG